MDEEILKAVLPWRENLALFSAADREAVKQIKETLGKSASGTWLYVGAGNDVRPLALSNPGSAHWWVDPVYDPKHYWYQHDMVGKMYTRLVNLNENPSVVPNEKNKKISTLFLSDKTQIVFAGGESTREDLYPGFCDVVFLSDITPGDPAELAVLKNGGFVVEATRGAVSDVLSLASINGLNNAFVFVKSYLLKIRPGQRGAVSVFRKSRDLTKEEDEWLRLDKVFELFLNEPRGSFGVLESQEVESGNWQTEILKIMRRKMVKLGKLEPSTVALIKKTIQMKFNISELRMATDRRLKEIVKFYDNLGD